MQKWKELLAKFGNPITRLEKYLKKKGLLTDERTKALRKEAMEQVRNALKTATSELLPPIDSLFEDVYKDIPYHIEEQRQELKAHLRKYPDDYHVEKFVGGKEFMTNK